MTSVERLTRAIRGETVDRVPSIPLIKQFCTRQLGLSFTDYNRDHTVLVAAQIGIHDRWEFDCFSTMGYPYREAGDCGLPIEWMPDSQPHALDVLVKSRDDLANLKQPDPWTGPLMRDRLEAIRLFKKRRPEVAVLGWVEGCFAQAATFLGLQQLLLDVAVDPDLVKLTMDFCLDMEIAFAHAQIEAGADLIGVGDAAASLVSREDYRSIVLPFEDRLLGSIRDQGMSTKLHICGNITRLLPDIATLPVNMVDIDWMVSLEEARYALGPKICLCGNFDPVRVLLHGAPPLVKAECLRCIRESGAPYVLSAGCEVPPDAPAENFAAACVPYEPSR